MQKRAEKRSSRYVKGAAFSEIFILILAIVAIAFILGEANFASAQEGQNLTFGEGGGGEVTDAELTALYGPGFNPFSDDSNTQDGAQAGGLTPEQQANRRAFAGGGAGTDGGVPTGQQQPQGPPSGGGGEAGGNASVDYGKVLTALGAGIATATAVYSLVQLLGPAFGADKGLTDAISAALAAGVLAGQLSAGAFAAFETTKGASGRIGAGVGVVVAIVVFVALYKKTKEKIITFSCTPWQAPIGGDRCEECNNNPFQPCSEYRCRALGQACQLLNKNKPGRENCAWVNPNDVNSPTITPWVGVLGPVEEGLKYISDTSIRPPALGVKIVKGNNECLKAYTPLRFGITTNEPAQCKVDYNHTAKFEDMQYYFGGSSYYEYNHTEAMRLPGPDNYSESDEQNPILRNDGTSQLFVRCRDANGNENVDEYSVKFCVDKSPDTTPPFIEGASISSGNPVMFGAGNLSVDVYVNEPAECRWSVESKSYDEMEVPMSCDDTAPQIINAVPTYVCVANLTGLKNNFENKFYFRCKDQPGKDESVRNVMVQSYNYILKGSQPLNIIAVSPNGTTSGSSESVSVDLEVETDDGAEEGKAICSFSPFGTNGTYVVMFETNSFRHKQTLQLTSGIYTYYFRCVDLGGNTVDAKTTFSVFSDRVAPGVARVYKEEGTGLKIVTDEDAECAYSLTSCNFVFDEGLRLIYSNPSIKTNSYVEWKPNAVYYIKCRDFYGNEPNPNDCSVIVKPVQSSPQ